jgi:hypothetical protein
VQPTGVSAPNRAWRFGLPLEFVDLFTGLGKNERDSGWWVVG